MSLGSIFWQFDQAEFAKLHEAEHKARREWLVMKIKQCEADLDNSKLMGMTKERTRVLDDLHMFKSLLEAMYGKEVEGE